MEIEQDATVLTSLQLSTPSSTRRVSYRSGGVQTANKLPNHIRLRPLRLLTALRYGLQASLFAARMAHHRNPLMQG
jgi:hypothetical protein